MNTLLLAKRLFLSCALICSLWSFSSAQALWGAGLAYGTDIDELGIAIDGEFFVNNDVSISPDVIIYFVEDGRDFKQGFWEFNANAHYYFSESGAAAVYGFAGVNLATSTFKPDGDNRSSDADLGLNLGIGSNFDIKAGIRPFAEFKFAIGGFDQAVLVFGIHF